MINQESYRLNSWCNERIKELEEIADLTEDQTYAIVSLLWKQEEIGWKNGHKLASSWSTNRAKRELVQQFQEFLLTA